MTDFPYTPVNGRIRPLFDKLSQVGRPPKVDKKWLESLGFKTTLRRILKALGFVDAANQPTDTWQAYRDKSRSKQVMAEAVRGGYADLFSTYPNACQVSDENLRNFFHSKSSANSSTIGLMVSAFKILCDLSEFATVPETSTAGSDTKIEIVSGAVQSDQVLPHSAFPSGPGNVTVNINIQLTVPETTDQAVYDGFFSALKKHLLS